MITKIQAHRGASAYKPENTLEAFALAAEMKAGGVELDVHLTKDGQIVVAHDERLERVSDGTGHIVDYTLEELKKFNFNKLFPDLPAHRIPTLAEVYELLKPTGLSVNVELKTTHNWYLEMPPKLFDLERAAGMQGRILYSSFNHYSLRATRALDPDAEIGLLYSYGLVDPWIYATQLRATAIHPHYAIVAALPETVKHCHDHGVKVNVWTVDDPEMLTVMYKLGVDAVITNKPDVALTVRTERQG